MIYILQKPLPYLCQAAEYFGTVSGQ